jgi:hypothetical protein
MSWIPLDSTAVRAVRYLNAESSLELKFCDGAIYRYSAVPELTFQEFLRAESKGRYFNLHLRTQYPFDPVHPAESNGP